MAGLEDLLKGVQSGGSGGGGLGDVLGGVLGGGGGGLGGVLGSILEGGGGSSGGGAAGGVLKALLPVVVGMLGSGGLTKILGGMRANGLGAQADSWVGTGENESVGADDVRRVVDPAELQGIAQQLGVSEDEAAAALAEVLPHAVDQVTPDGQVPADEQVDASLDRLKGLFA